MGQEDTFASGQAFVVATTTHTSTRWQEQARALPATVTIVTDAASQCGHA